LIAATESIIMNGIHDLGGMHGFGPIRLEPNEPVFTTIGNAASSA
jgi:hypothetical protein